MTRDELLELLLVERHTPLPPQPREPEAPPPVMVVDDSEIATARRRRELVDALTNHDNTQKGANRCETRR